MKARYSVSVPTVMAPASTLWPPTQEQQPHGEEEGIAHRRAVPDAKVDPAVGEVEGLLRDLVELGHLVALGGEGADDADPAQILLHHAGEHAQLLLKRQPARAEAQLRHDRAPGGKGREAERQKAQHRLASEEQGRADAQQQDEQHEADEAGIDDHAQAFDVEHAARDQLAGVHAVMEAEAQPLQLGVVGHAQVVGDALADGLAFVVLPHGEEATKHAGADQQAGRAPERRARRDLVATVKQAGRGIHRLAQIVWDQKLEDRRHHRGA